METAALHSLSWLLNSYLPLNYHQFLIESANDLVICFISYWMSLIFIIPVGWESKNSDFDEW